MIVIGICHIACGLFQCLYNGFFSGDIMSNVYICDGDVFETLEMAVDYANQVYCKTGIILGIEEIV